MPTNDSVVGSSRRALASQLSRRRFMVLCLATSGSALLAACQSTPPAPAAPKAPDAPKPTAAPPPPTQVPPTAAAAKPAAQPAATTAPPAAAAPAPTVQAVAAKPGGKKVYKLAVLGDISGMDPATMNQQVDF